MVLITCVVAYKATAQVSLFNKIYDDFGGWEIAGVATENEDSTILVESSTMDFFAQDSTFYKRLYFSLLTKEGSVLTTKLLTFPTSEYRACSDFKRINNEWFTVGIFNSIDTVTNTRTPFSKGIYLNALGDTSRTFPIAQHIFPNGKPGLGLPIRTSYGTYIATALYNRTEGDSMYLFSSDSNGNIIWVKEFRELHMLVNTIIETPDKGFLLVGYEFDKELYKMSPDGLELIYIGHPERLWYAKIDSAGTMQWQQKLTGAGYELYDTIYYKYKFSNQTRFRDAIPTADGNYVLAGCIETNPYITKINMQGERLWEHKYFSKLTYLDTLRRRANIVSIREVEGYLYAFGYIDSLENGNEETTSYYFLMKLTASGKTMWIRYIRAEKNAYLYNLTPYRNGFILTGAKHDLIPKYGSQDAWVIKLDEHGCLQAGCHLNDIIDTVTSIPFVQKSNKTELTIYPNPNSTGIFTLSGTHTQPYTVKVTDATGKQILYTTIYNGTINVSGNPNGMYYVRIEDKEGNVLLKQALVIAR